jgi:hypothetical protein
MTTWTNEKFESMSWHDNHVHSFRIVEGEHGAGELLLDLDYITEWLPSEEGGFRFKVVPAILRFSDVTALRLSLDYAAATAALGPFALHVIERRTEMRSSYSAQVWTLRINWPVGEISFEASGFEQHSTGPEVVTDRQWLRPGERSEASR